MNHEMALEIVSSCLIGENSIPQQLRAKQGLNQPLFNKLVDAVHFLIIYYQDRDMVPKRLGFCMVDIFGAFSFKEGFYNDEDSVLIEDAGILLQSLATDLFS